MDINEIFGKIGFDIKMAAFNGVNFLIFFLILNKYVFKKIGKIVEERRILVEQSVKDAERLDSELKEVQAKSVQILKEANKEANEIVKRYKVLAGIEAEKIRLDAEQKASELISTTKEKLQKEKESIYEDLKQKAADLAIAATEKILSEKIDNKQDRKITQKFLKTLDK